MVEESDEGSQHTESEEDDIEAAISHVESSSAGAKREKVKRVKLLKNDVAARVKLAQFKKTALKGNIFEVRICVNSLENATSATTAYLSQINIENLRVLLFESELTQTTIHA